MIDKPASDWIRRQWKEPSDWTRSQWKAERFPTLAAALKKAGLR